MYYGAWKTIQMNEKTQLAGAAKGIATKEVNGEITCEDASFGGDPEPGVPKQCYCRWAPQIKTTDLCAYDSEYSSCPCTGTVYFGTYESIMEYEVPQYARSVWNAQGHYHDDDSILCTISKFGDPLPDITDKACYCQEKPTVRKLDR